MNQCLTYLNLTLRGMIRYLYNVSVQDACFWGGGGICQYKYTPNDDCKKINSLPASAGFIQVSLSKIQGLFKDFSRLFYSFQGL